MKKIGSSFPKKGESEYRNCISLNNFLQNLERFQCRQFNAAQSAYLALSLRYSLLLKEKGKLKEIELNDNNVSGE